MIEEAYLDQDEWTRKSIRTVAGMGKFNSDAAVMKCASPPASRERALVRTTSPRLGLTSPPRPPSARVNRRRRGRLERRAAQGARPRLRTAAASARPAGPRTHRRRPRLDQARRFRSPLHVPFPVPFARPGDTYIPPTSRFDVDTRPPADSRPAPPPRAFGQSRQAACPNSLTEASSGFLPRPFLPPAVGDAQSRRALRPHRSSATLAARVQVATLRLGCCTTAATTPGKAVSGRRRGRSSWHHRSGPCLPPSAWTAAAARLQLDASRPRAGARLNSKPASALDPVV